MRFYGKILLLLVGFIFATKASGAVFHVDGDSPAPGDGTAVNPYQTIPQGLQAATQYDKVVVHKCDGLVNGSAVGPLAWGHYLLSSSLTVEQDETLELEAGVVIKFKLYWNNSTNPSIIVNGSLRALGQDADRVYFTSERDNTVGASDYVGSAPAWADWYHLVFNDSSDDNSCLIEHAEIRYAGRYWWENWGWYYRSEEAVSMVSASPTIRDTVIRDTFGDALECNLTSSPAIQRMTFQNNIVNGLNILGGTINDTRIWSNTDVVYYLDSTVWVAEGTGSLTLPAGLVVKFHHYTNSEQNISLIISGCLKVLGTSDQPVILTSIRDDTAQVADGTNGDTNNDGPSNGGRGDWYHIVFNDGSDDACCLIEHAEIRYAGRYWWENWGWYYRSEEAVSMVSASPTIRDTFIRDTYGDALECNLTSSPTIQRMTFQNNTVNGLNMLGGTINDTRIWSNTDVVYYLDSTVWVAEGTGSLSLPAGLVVKFHRYTNSEQNISLIISGCLKVLGTSEQPVILTSIRDDTAQVADGTNGDTNNDGPSNGGRGDWYHVHFNDSSDDNTCLIEHAQIRYAGRYWWENWGWYSRSEEAVSINTASPTITDTKFDKCWGYPVEMDLSSFPNLRGLEADGLDTQDISAVHIVGGTMAAGGNWSNPGIPYYLDGSVSVAAGNMLTIEPGAVLKFKVLNNIGLYFGGSKLNLSEIKPDPIVFTSIRDDDVYGDTNNDGPSDGQPGDWGQVRFSNIGGSDVVIGHVVFRYAGNGSGSADIPALGLDFSQANIMNCTFEQCLGACIEVDNVSLANISNILSNSNKTGIYVSGQSEATISGWTSYRDQTALIVSDAYADLWNSILSYYSPAAPGGCGVFVDDGGSLNMSYNNVWSPWGTVYYPVEDDQTGSNGNISLNPRFMDIYAGDLHLKTGSPCIDAGNNALLLFDENDMDQDADMSEPIPWDLDGNFRFCDDPVTMDTGIGDPPIIDMGAYEYYEGPGICGDINHPYLRSDLDHDCYVNLTDFAIFAIQWLDCTAPECD